MPTYNGVSVTINVAGQPLPEYQLQVDEATKVATCWIPSHIGKEFTILIHNTTRRTQLRACVKMDGQKTNIRRIGPGERNLVDRCRPSPTTYRTFVFSQGKPVDDDELPPEVQNVAGVGVIQLIMDEGQLVVEPYLKPSGDYRKIDIPEQRMIPERGKKGLDECVGLGPIRSRPPEKRRIESHSFEKTGFWAKMVFLYRPLPFLQAQGIAPPDPARANPNPPSQKCKRADPDLQPEAGPSKVPKTFTQRAGSGEIIEISDEEDVEKLWALRARIDKALAKKDPLAAQVKKEVKREKPLVIPEGEVIDLT